MLKHRPASIVVDRKPTAGLRSAPHMRADEEGTMAVDALQRRIIGLAALLLATTLHASALAAPRVLKVGSYQGQPGDYASVQSAVDAAQPGDWILIGPGVYHEQATANDGVRITT